MADHMQQLLANVEALVSGQARIELCLDGLASEQRLHGDRLLGLEKKVSQITDKRLSQNSDKATSHNKAAKEDDSSTRSPLASPMPSPMPRKASALSFDIGSDDGVKMVSWMTGTGSMQWEENDDGLLPPASVAGEAPTLAADWPHCIPCRKFGLLPESPDSAIAKLPTQTLMERMTLKVTSAQPQEGKTSFQSRFGSCILEPSSKKRIVFDLCAMVFLLYDLCVTPVAIAWDFPMKGWLLYCTTFVATFWTVDIVVTMRTGFYQQGTLVVKPGLILKRYFRTTMLPDLLIVLVDWLTVFANAIFPEEQSDNPELIGAKLVRFSKATRVVRIISVTRVVRILEYLEHIGDRLHGGSSLKYVGDMARLIVIIIWINHVMSCTWFYVGRVTEGDTGTSWLMDPIRDENSPLYSEALPLFQYTTAFHWAITQMTPGSMQVFPRNSLERMFNIFALIFGMIFFSSLISSLSATMVNFRMKSTQTANQMSELRRFLRQAKISNKLSMGVQKQALERLMEVKPLTVTDVTALKILSSDLRMELQHELCHPYVMRSGFYRVCQHADPAALKSLMYECITFTFFSAGEPLHGLSQKLVSRRL
ncbi:unnamed protein product [Effrenium voratum]|nr:unnamed protein product [Effrenium voratum]